MSSFNTAYNQLLSRPVSVNVAEDQKQAVSSSSGDNSSIERLSYGARSNVSEPNVATQRSQPQTSRSRQGRRRGAHRSNDSSNGENWKVMDYSYFPTLLDKQLQVISVQLSEIQFSNSLQLRLMFKMMKIFLASKRRSWPRNGVPWSLWLTMLLYPLIIQIAYYFYKK
jgi:hypothetical protein